MPGPRGDCQEKLRFRAGRARSCITAVWAFLIAGKFVKFNFLSARFFTIYLCTFTKVVDRPRGSNVI